MIKFSCFLLLCPIFLIGQTKDLKWTDQNQKDYMEKSQNEQNWDLEMLKEDIEFLGDTWPTQPAITEYPSPVADYDWGYVSIRNIQLPLKGKHILGSSIGYAKDLYRQSRISDSTHYYIPYFNILILTDRPESIMRRTAAVSRNYPHYLSTGTQKTNRGKVDWVQMSLANGANFAIISQRYFDLRFGATILVAPLKDGSLRFLQLDLNPGSYNLQTIQKEDNVVQLFLDQLANNQRVVDFFNQPNVVEFTY